MATVVFIGSQANVAQVDTVQVTAYDAASTYILTIGAGNLTHVISVPGTTDVDGTADALKTAWNASTHAYAKYITATVSTDTVTLTADTAGVPFTVASSKSGGTGTIGAVASSVAMVSASDVNDAANYAGGALPANSDTFIHARGAPALAWNLEAHTALTSLIFKHPRGAGNIGLERMGFAISADGQTADSTAREYRPHYLKMQIITLEIGEEFGPSTISAATRIKIDNTKTAATTNRIFSVAGTSLDSGVPTLKMLVNSASGNLVVSSCAGGIGIAIDSISETSLIGDIVVDDPSGASRFFTGDGVTMGKYEQFSGVAKLRSAVTLANITVQGGTVETIGTYDVTVALVDGAGVFIGSSEGDIVTLNHDGGTVDMIQQSVSRTITNYNPKTGAVLKLNGTDVAITNWNPPTNLHTVTYT